MGRNKRIPLVKNRLDAKHARKSSKSMQTWTIILILAFMLLHVWLRVQTNMKKAEIRQLENELKRAQNETEKLQAEVERLSNFSRINKIAREELGLVFIPNEDVIEIQAN